MLMNSELVEKLTNLVGENNILTSEDSRKLFSSDESLVDVDGKFAEAVVFVENTKQVQEIVKFCNEFEIPITSRGAGTNVVGSCRVISGGVVLSFAKMNKILEISKENMTARLQPGVVVGEFQRKVEARGLYYPPDPSSLDTSTIGGGIAQASAGARTFKYGTTRDYVIDLEVVTSEGEVMRTGSNTIKNACGYNLTGLFVGSEGTLGVITEATVKLIPKPETKIVIMAYFDTIQDCINTVDRVIGAKINPATLDFMDKNAIDIAEKYYNAGLLTDKECALLIELDGNKPSIDYERGIIEKILQDCGASQVKYSTNEEEYEKIWEARRASFHACKKIKQVVTTDDIVVPRENIAELVRGTREICEKYGLIACMVGHIGDGSVHPQIPIDTTDEDEVARYRKAKAEIYELTARLDGVLSGEHGIGLAKMKYLDKFVDTTAIKYMQKIKEVMDEKNILNPNKIF